MAKLDGLVYPTEAAGTTEWQTIPVGTGYFGGEWLPGVAKSFQEIGMTKTEALAVVKEHGLPLVEAKADAPPDGALPAGATIPDSDPATVVDDTLAAVHEPAVPFEEAD